AVSSSFVLCGAEWARAERHSAAENKKVSKRKREYTRDIMGPNFEFGLMGTAAGGCARRESPGQSTTSRKHTVVPKTRSSTTATTARATEAGFADQPAARLRQQFPEPARDSPA